MAKFKKIFFQIVRILICAALLIAVVSLFINQHIKNQTEDDILYTATDSEGISQEEAQELINFGADCIIVLGAGITDSETPSPMLKDRLDLGIDLYKNGAAPKILLSGDNGQVGHNEIHVMLSYTKKSRSS